MKDSVSIKKRWLIVQVFLRSELHHHKADDLYVYWTQLLFKKIKKERVSILTPEFDFTYLI